MAMTVPDVHTPVKSDFERIVSEIFSQGSAGAASKSRDGSQRKRASGVPGSCGVDPEGLRSDCRLLFAILQLEELVVEAALSQQIFMPALFPQLTPVKDQDMVGPLDR